MDKIRNINFHYVLELSIVILVWKEMKNGGTKKRKKKTYHYLHVTLNSPAYPNQVFDA